MRSVLLGCGLEVAQAEEACELYLYGGGSQACRGLIRRGCLARCLGGFGE